MIAEEIKVEQGTDEWLTARLGRATASRFGDVLATIRTGEATARAKYRIELALERSMGMPTERYKSAAMIWGTETEELARVEYQLKTGNIADESGFFQHKTLMAGASPDGLIGEDGLIEIKSREIYNHVKMLRGNMVDNSYMPQIQGQLWVTGRRWCDFVSFAPELPENAQLFIRRVMRDEDYIRNLESELTRFLQEVESETIFIKNYQG